MFLIDWIKKKLVARELNKSKFLKKVMLWLDGPGNKRLVVALFLGLGATLRGLGYLYSADLTDQFKSLVENLPPGMDAGAFIFLAWSIVKAKRVP